MDVAEVDRLARGYTGDMSSIELLTKERSSRNDCGARATCWFSACDRLICRTFAA